MSKPIVIIWAMGYLHDLCDGQIVRGEIKKRGPTRKLIIYGLPN